MTSQGFLESVVASINERMNTAIEKFSRDNALIATWFNDVIRDYLAQRGWFDNGRFGGSQYLWLKEAIEQHQDAEIEDFMVNHVRSIIEDIASTAHVTWPHRRTILADAFDTHSKRLYALSIPVMLAQADGMAHEILGAFLFTNYKGEIGDKANAMMESDFEERPLAKSFLSLLLEASGLALPTGKRDKNKENGIPVSPLNRHGVLHGIDYDYAMECNSLRAIALIDFLNWVHSEKSKQQAYPLGYPP